MQWLSFPRKGECEVAFQFCYCEPPLKNQCGEREILMLLFWSALIVGGRVVRLVELERWECGETGKVGGWWGWQCEKSGRAVRLQRCLKGGGWWFGVGKVGGWWIGKVRDFWFYSRVGDAEWVKDFTFFMLIKRQRGSGLAWDFLYRPQFFHTKITASITKS